MKINYTRTDIAEDARAHAWSVAKSLQAQVTIAETALAEIANTKPAGSNDDEHDLLQDRISVAQMALQALADHRRS